jgi:hypothetical protein
MRVASRQRSSRASSQGRKRLVRENFRDRLENKEIKFMEVLSQVKATRMQQPALSIQRLNNLFNVPRPVPLRLARQFAVQPHDTLRQ